jgi:hypothetical protein
MMENLRPMRLGKILDRNDSPHFPAALALLNYHQRMRCEGYDIERMMDAAGLTLPATSPTAEVPAASVEPTEAQA